MKKQLFWSMAIRFVFESYLELVICVTIGLLNLEWSSKNFSITYCSIFNIIFAVIVLVMPILTSIFYYINIDRVDEEEFKRKYGTLYDGLQLDDSEDKRKSAIIYPFLFIVRRLVFMITVVWFDYFVWLQISTQFALCIMMIMYLGFIWPFKSAFITWMEITNELAVLLLCYFMFTFTDWIPKAKTRYLIGWIFIAIIVIHLSVHLAVLIRSTFIEMKRKAKDKYAKKNKELYEETPSQEGSRIQRVMRKRFQEKLANSANKGDLSGWRKNGRKGTINWQTQVSGLQ